MSYLCLTVEENIMPQNVPFFAATGSSMQFFAFDYGEEQSTLITAFNLHVWKYNNLGQIKRQSGDLVACVGPTAP
jgi:hypothetical protein